MQKTNFFTTLSALVFAFALFLVTLKPALAVTCQDNPVSPPSGYLWKADCGGSACSSNSQCPQNDYDSANVDASSSNWCFGFEGPNNSTADWRCLKLVHPPCINRGDSGCGGAPPPPTAPACDASQLNMGVSPNPVNVGQQVTFSLSGSQGSTWIGDSWSGGVDCSGAFWSPPKTCSATAGGSNLTWTHNWQNCAPNNCSIKSPLCSKQAQYTVNAPIPVQCFRATEDQNQRNALLNCSQGTSITQAISTISNFQLSAGNGTKTIFVRFLRTSQGETLANCSDSNKCIDRQFPITLALPGAGCTSFSPDGLTPDGTETVGNVLIPVFRTTDSTGSTSPKHISVTVNPANATVNQPTSQPALSFARSQTNASDWSISSIPANSSTTSPVEYTVSGTVTSNNQTSSCPQFIIRVPVQGTGNCSCSSSDTCIPNCSFTKLTGVTYADPIKCSLNPNIPITIPASSDKNSWCNGRAKRTEGDADGNGQVDTIDYTYYIRTVIGGKVPPAVNPDFDGDGVVGQPDLTIWLQGRGL